MRIQVSDDFRELRAVIKVVGVGGAGGNAINRMAEAGIRAVELIAANSDAQDLRRSQAEIRVQIGEQATRGLGVGGDPEKGLQAMMESEVQIREVLTGADLVFITAGMGGGTGTGGAPLVARWAKEMGALTIGVVTRPFDFEKLNKTGLAEQGIQEMRKNVDILLIIPNQRLLEIIETDTTAEAAFRMADDVLRKSIQSISDLITVPGKINMDLNDLRAVTKDAGDALIGMGESSGPSRAILAAKAAIQSPLLENVVIDGARGLLVNISGCGNGEHELKMREIEEAVGLITGSVSQDVKLKMGTSYDDSLGSAVRITVVATGFPVRRPGRSLARLGVGHGRTLSPLHEFRDAPPLAAGSAQDWSKPAFLRLKARKLK